MENCDVREITALLVANGAATTGALYAITSGFGLAQTQAMTMKTKAILQKEIIPIILLSLIRFIFN